MLATGPEDLATAVTVGKLFTVMCVCARYVSDDTAHLLRLTQLMLATGPEDLATAVTVNDGDTLLNKLLKFFGSARPRDRDEYVDEVPTQSLAVRLHEINLFAPTTTTTVLHPFNGLFSRTTWVSRYQKGKASLDLNEARDDGVFGCSGISWTMFKQSAPRCRQITTPTPQAGCSS